MSHGHDVFCERCGGWERCYSTVDCKGFRAACHDCSAELDALELGYANAEAMRADVEAEMMKRWQSRRAANA